MKDQQGLPGEWGGRTFQMRQVPEAGSTAPGRPQFKVRLERREGQAAEPLIKSSKACDGAGRMGHPRRLSRGAT